MSYKTLQCFSVSTIGIVCSLMPLIVCVMAGLMLGEKVTAKDYLTMVLVITAVMFVILGAQGTEKQTMQTDWVAMSCLIAQPFLLAGGVIAMRKMKGMHTMVVSTYTNFFLASASFFAIYA
jgi:drug/metabolite transporter (DMT)-like permease